MIYAMFHPGTNSEHARQHTKCFQSWISVLCLYLSNTNPPEVGYAQGMNDLLARFLVVTNSEVDSYWMFAKYMEYKQEDFLEVTMMKKVGK